VSSVQVFVEGNSTLKLPLIQFIGKAVPASRGSIAIHLGKNKDETIKDFLRTLHENSSANVFLLVDSDAPDDGKLFEKLKQTTAWRKHAPKRVQAERIHWMVQVMESWFLADGAALKAYYKKSFKASALPKGSNVEQISKPDVFKALKQVAALGYEKAAHAPNILGYLSPNTVRARAAHCGRFLDALSTTISK
jgi:hypothetical protein